MPFVLAVSGVTFKSIVWRGVVLTVYRTALYCIGALSCPLIVGLLNQPKSRALTFMQYRSTVLVVYSST